MTGYLIYYPQEAAKNKGFIEMFRQYGAVTGIEFQYVSIQEYTQKELPELVLNRTRQPFVSRWYQERGIPVFHVEELVELSNDKYKTLQYLEKHLPAEILAQKWCPDSEYLSSEELNEAIRKRKKFPDNKVIKSVSGHGGNEVFLAEGYWQEALQGKNCILQERIKSHCQDLRVYILGGEIYQAVLRTGKEDFRSNFSLGGSVEAYELNPEQIRWIQCFLQAFPGEWMGMLGMDFILASDGRLIFNEIEEMVGCRMLYQCTRRDIVKDYIAWLKGNMV